jgi:hypothetical protein
MAPVLLMHLEYGDVAKVRNIPKVNGWHNVHGFWTVLAVCPVKMPSASTVKKTIYMRTTRCSLLNSYHFTVNTQKGCHIL